MRFAPLSQSFRGINQMSKSNLQPKTLLSQRLPPYMGGYCHPVASGSGGEETWSL